MRKNLIILMIDGGRSDRTDKSPIFNEIKEKSICLSQPVTYGPHTIASMHAVFSGTYGTRTGTNSYWSTYKFKKDKFKTISEYLHELDYYTVADVVNNLVIPNQGLDELNIHDELKDNLTVKHIKYIKKMKQKNDEQKNFFLYLQYSNIHTGIMNEVLKKYDNFSTEFFENKLKNEKRYDELFLNAEKYLAKIIQTIYELELEKNSIILIMSDHGISVGEKLGERAYGVFCYDYTLKTFGYFLIPDIIPLEISQQIRTIDYMPTILDYLQIPLDSNYEKIDGESLRQLFEGGKILEKSAFSETGNPLNGKAPPKEPNTHSIRTSTWKLIYNSHNETKELYNLKDDPEENNNLIGEKLEIEESLWNELMKIKNNN